MPTVVDSLVVEIGLDPSKYKKGLTDALDTAKKGKDQLVAGGKDVESATSHMGEAFSKLRNNVLGMAALFTGGLGLKEFIQQTVQTDMHVGRLATVLGISVKDLSTWRNAGLLAGGTGESFSNVLRTITLELAKLQLTGESSIIPYFRALGINVVDSAGKMKNATQLLLEVSDAITARRVDPARATLILQSMGADEASINAVLKGRAALEKYLATAKEVGTITQADADAADRLNEAYHRLTLSSQEWGRSMLTYVEPVLTRLLNDMSDATKGNAASGAGIKPFSGPSSHSLLGWLLGVTDAAPAAAAPGGTPAVGGGSMDRFAAAIAKIESGGNYNAIGPPTRTGDRAYGKYQVMGANIPGWTAETLGQSMTPQQFLASPAAQDAVFNKKFRELISKYGNSQDAASAWFTGRPLSGGAGARDVTGTSGLDYVNRFNGAILSGMGSKSIDNSRSSTADVKVGAINIHTAAKDAGPIARDIGKALQETSFGVHANTGQN